MRKLICIILILISTVVSAGESTRITLICDHCVKTVTYEEGLLASIMAPWEGWLILSQYGSPTNTEIFCSYYCLAKHHAGSFGALKP